MKIFNGLRKSRQDRTDEADSSVDSGTPGCVVSMLSHLCLMVGLAFTFIGGEGTHDIWSFTAPILEAEQELVVPPDCPLRESAAEESV